MGSQYLKLLMFCVCNIKHTIQLSSIPFPFPPTIARIPVAHQIFSKSYFKMWPNHSAVYPKSYFEGGKGEYFEDTTPDIHQIQVRVHTGHKVTIQKGLPLPHQSSQYSRSYAFVMSTSYPMLFVT